MAQPNAPVTDPRVVVALDFESLSPCERLLDQLDPSFCRVKIGKELFTAVGPVAVKAAHSRGFDVFLDLKFHDIPVTVAKAVRAAADLGVWMVNVHTSGGARMLACAADALAVRQSLHSRAADPEPQRLEDRQPDGPGADPRGGAGQAVRGLRPPGPDRGG